MKPALPVALPPDALTRLTAIDAALPWLHSSVLEAIESHTKTALESLDKKALTNARALIGRLEGHGELVAQLAEDGTAAAASAHLPGSKVSEGMLFLSKQDQERIGRLELLEAKVSSTIQRAKFALPRKLDSARALAFAQKVLGTHPNVAESSPLPNEPEWRPLLAHLPATTVQERFVRARFQWIGEDPFPREEFERLSKEGSRDATKTLYFKAFHEPDEVRHPLAIRLAEQGDPGPALSIADKLKGKSESWAKASEWLLVAARSPVDEPALQSTEYQKIDRDKAALTAMGMHLLKRAPLEPTVLAALSAMLDGRTHREFDTIASGFGVRSAGVLVASCRP
ncbi:MAG: hypothetical protein Q8K32_36185 [Archangium sp.]|nr:hypothetical protein [Archangium sp.]